MNQVTALHRHGLRFTYSHRVGVILASVFLLGTMSQVNAESIVIPGHVWSALSETQKHAFKEAYDVSLIPIESYGIVVDAQTLDDSRPGNNAGSQLGAAVGSAAYVDNAFKGNNWNYSATKNLAAGLLGAAIGSSLDTTPTSVFATRYFVKLKNGAVVTVNERKSDPFKIPPGLCVEIGPLRVAQEPICEASKEAFLAKLESIHTISTSPKPKERTPTQSTDAQQVRYVTKNVKCNIGNSSPIIIDKFKCSQIERVEVNE